MTTPWRAAERRYSLGSCGARSCSCSSQHREKNTKIQQNFEGALCRLVLHNSHQLTFQNGSINNGEYKNGSQFPFGFLLQWRNNAFENCRKIRIFQDWCFKSIFFIIIVKKRNRIGKILMKNTGNILIIFFFPIAIRQIFCCHFVRK